MEVEVEEDATVPFVFTQLQTKPLQTIMEIHLQGKAINKDYDLLGNKKQICDQKLKGGNLALKNNIKKPIPLRVIRGHKSQNSYCGKVYTYDGLLAYTRWLTIKRKRVIQGLLFSSMSKGA